MNQFVFLLLMAAFFADTAYGAVLYTGIIGLTLPNIVMYLALILLISAAASRGQLTRIRVPGFSYLVIILTAVSLSLLYNRLLGTFRLDFIDKVRYAKGFVFEPIVLYTISFLLVRSRSQGLRFLAIFSIVIGILNLLTLVFAALHISLLTRNPLYSEAGRFVGFSGNPNKTSYVLCVFVGFQYYFMKYYPAKWLKMLFGFLILCGIGTIMLSGSRGGLVGIVLLWLMLLYIWRDYKLLLVLPAIFLPLFIIVMLATGNEAFHAALVRFAEVGSGDANAATAGRSEIWAELFDYYLSSGVGILIGSGFGVAQFFGIGARAHNMYLQMLVEFGALGLLFWLAALIGALRFITKYRTRDLATERFKQTIFSCMCVVMAAWMFTSLVGVMQLLGFVFGLATATLVYRPKQKQIVRKKFIG